MAGSEAMAQAPRDLVPTRSALHFFGAELRHWRTLRGVSQDQLGRITHDSGSTIGKIEKALRRPSLRLARNCDQALDTGDALQRLWPLVEAELDADTAASAVPAREQPSSDEVGLHWSADLRATVDTVGRLWRADVERRAMVVGAGWIAAAFAGPSRDWLLDWMSTDPSRAGGRRVGQAEVEALWSMCGTFADLDHKLGGGHARSTLAHYASHAVLPMLEGSYPERTGRSLMAAAARLCNLGAFMAFDCELHGLAQRYYIQALRLAQAGADRALGAHILADMSMQAHYLGDAREALALAVAGQRTAKDCGSFATLARCHAMEARAHALLGDAVACGRAMSLAERALETAGDEPSWIRFFTSEQLAAEFMYAASELGRSTHVQQLAPAVLTSSEGMQRRFALATVTLAASHLGGGKAEASHTDVDQACAVLGEALPVAAGLSSPRTLHALSTIRIRLRPHGARPAVRGLEERMESLIGATA
jgi:transcriptional regulator with XRE-family HTH domain